MNILTLAYSILTFQAPYILSLNDERYRAHPSGVPITVYEHISRREEIADPADSGYPPGVPLRTYEQGDEHEVDLEDDDDEEEEEEEMEEDPNTSFFNIVAQAEFVHKSEASHVVDSQNHTNVSGPASHENHTRHTQELHHVMEKSDREHLEHHMEVPLDTSNMSNLELAFHYFRTHDTDHNQNLDGIELIKYMIHQHQEEETHNVKEAIPPQKPAVVYDEDELIATVENILAEDDLNNDGFISRYEFLKSFEKQEREHEKQWREQHNADS